MTPRPMLPAERAAIEAVAATMEAEVRLRTVVPAGELRAWLDRAWREERRMVARAIESVAPYVPGSGFRAVHEAAARGEQP